MICTYTLKKNGEWFVQQTDIFEEMIPFWTFSVVFIPFVEWKKILFGRIIVPEYPDAYV